MKDVSPRGEARPSDAGGKALGARARFAPPGPRKVTCPIVDAHVHAREQSETRHLLDAMRMYGVTKAVVLTHLPSGLALRARHPDVVDLAVMLDYERLDNAAAFTRNSVRQVESALAHGAVAMKFWFAPPFVLRTGMHVDDARLTPVFALMERHRMPAIIHVGDPDAWFAGQYADRSLYAPKEAQYVPLESILRRYPAMPVIGAHFGGDPEHLDRLAARLAAFPNYFLDTSATKWMARELGRDVTASRRFVVEHAERILFGTDNVVLDRGDLDRYASRYWAHQILWEQDRQAISPIEDADVEGEPLLKGLDLPADALEQIYHRTAEALFGAIRR